MDFCWQSNIMSLFFNMLSRLVITFLPRSKHILISWLQSPSAMILEPPSPNKLSHCFHCFSFCFIDCTKDFDCVDNNKLLKILKEMGIPDHLTCILRNLYAGQEATEVGMEQQTGSKLGKEYVKAVYCHPAYLTYMQSTS